MRWLLVVWIGYVTCSCPCKTPSLCQPITSGPRKEIFGFGGGSNWKQYDWSLVTTVAWGTDPELMCHAHSKGVRVVLQAQFNTSIFSNPVARLAWINDIVQNAVANHLDGCNFDYESAVAVGSPVYSQYRDLVAETADAFHSKIPGSQVSMDAAWSPNGIDGRFYDWVGIADAVDIFYVMSYDLRSQIYDRCTASANSPAYQVLLGLQQFLDLGISPSKVVLGIPWYGYDYPCVDTQGAPLKSPNSTEFCSIASVPFRGAPCSDAAGSEVSYGDLMPILEGPTAVGARRWDNNTMSPYFNFVASDGSVHQMWYDDPESLQFKMKLAAAMGIRGVGPWNFDLLNYSNSSSKVKQQNSAMWSSFKVFLENSKDPFTDALQ